MGFVVKNTTRCGLLDLLCPHTCRGCGRLGAVLCKCCKNNMFRKNEWICPVCKNAFAKSSESCKNNGGGSLSYLGHCPECEVKFENLWVGGWREGVLEKMVEEYKYQSVRAMGVEMVELIDRRIPEDFGEDEEIAVVPLPTIGRHVRERGFDHTLELAKKLAKRRGWKCERALTREADTVQVGAKVAAREEQAEKAYAVRGELDANKHYILLDDVWTTGASMRAAEKVMRAAGAVRMSVAVIAVSRSKS